MPDRCRSFSRTADPIVHHPPARISLSGNAAFRSGARGRWAPGWSPRFLHPAEGAQREGVVFTTTTSRGKERLWLLTVYDSKAGRVEYVIVTPGFTANEVKIRVLPEGDWQCKAIITYRHSAIAPEGNEEVNKLDAHWAEQQRLHWETAINAVLTKGDAHD